MANQIRFYRIPKDERMMDEVICQECGRSIVNILEINGQPYGTRCGLKKLDIKMTKKQAKRAAYHTETFKALMETRKRSARDIVFEAYAVIEALKLPDPGRFNYTGYEYAELVLEMVS